MIQESESTSSTLLARAASHDPEAWRRLSELYGPLVLGWARHWGLQSSDAGDLVQAVFLAVHRSVGAFRKQRPEDSFRGWLFTIARNKLRDQLRERALEPQAAGGTAAHLAIQAATDDAERSALDETSHRDQAWLVRRAVELMQTDFEESTWRAFLLTTLDGMSVSDAAAELGLSVDSVYQARSRVLRRLRQEQAKLAPSYAPLFLGLLIDGGLRFASPLPHPSSRPDFAPTIETLTPERAWQPSVAGDRVRKKLP